MFVYKNYNILPSKSECNLFITVHSAISSWIASLVFLLLFLIYMQKVGGQKTGENEPLWTGRGLNPGALGDETGLYCAIPIYLDWI